MASNRSRLTGARSQLAVAAVSGGLAVPLAANGALNLSADSYMTLYAGRWVHGHGIPSVEPFGIEAAGRAWVDQQWLAQLVHYAAWSAGGYQTVAILTVALVAFAFALLGMLMHRLGASFPVAVICAGLATLPAYGHVFIRAQTLAFPLFVLLAWICLGGPARWPSPRRLLWIVPLLVVWANVHGSVILGTALAFSYLGARALFADSTGRLALAGLALVALATPLATPYGLETVDYYRALLANDAIHDNVTEWRPPTLPGSAPLFLLLTVCGVAFASAARRGWRPRAELAVWTALTAFAALVALRNEPWFGMAGATALSAAMMAVLPEPDAVARWTQRLVVGAVAAIAVAGAVTVLTRDEREFESLTSPTVLASVIEYAKRHPEARLLADGTSAPALLWQAPDLQRRVAFESRLEQYPEASLRLWYDWQRGQNVARSELSRRYAVLISSAETPALSRALSQPRSDTRLLARDRRHIAVLSTRGNLPPG